MSGGIGYVVPSLSINNWGKLRLTLLILFTLLLWFIWFILVLFWIICGLLLFILFNTLFILLLKVTEVELVLFIVSFLVSFLTDCKRDLDT